jgi:hypothetical protein
MQLKSRFVHFFLVLLMGFLGVISLLLLEFFQYEAPVPATYIPADTEWAIRVDLERLAKEEAYTLLFEAKDEQLITTLRKIADDRVRKRTEKGPLTVDFRRDVVIFGLQKANTHYIGIQLKVSDPDAFRRNIKNYLSKGQYADVKGNRAIILTRTDKKTPSENDKKGMARLISGMLANTRKWELPHATVLKPSFLTIETTAFRDKQGTMTLDFFEEGHELSLKGTFKPKVPLRPADYSLKPAGLYLSTAIIPDGFSDSLNHLLPVGDFRFPELRAITIDYLGLAIAQTEVGMRPLPKMNVILESKYPFPADSLLRTVPDQLRGPHNSIHAASLTYYVKQIDQNTVFIGLDTNAIQLQKARLLCDLRGSLETLNRIDANPTLIAFMDLVPQVRFGKLFIGSTKSVELFITQPKGKTCVIRGKLLFKDDAYPVHETVKLLVGLGLAD